MQLWLLGSSLTPLPRWWASSFSPSGWSLEQHQPGPCTPELRDAQRPPCRQAWAPWLRSLFWPAHDLAPRSAMWGCTWYFSERNKQKELLIRTIRSVPLCREEDLNLCSSLIYFTCTCSSPHVVRPSFLFFWPTALYEQNKWCLDTQTSTLHSLKAIFRYSIVLFNCRYSRCFWYFGIKKKNFGTFRFHPKNRCWILWLQSMNTAFTVYCLSLSPALLRGWLICTCLLGFADSLSRIQPLSWTCLCMSLQLI